MDYEGILATPSRSLFPQTEQVVVTQQFPSEHSAVCQRLHFCQMRLMSFYYSHSWLELKQTNKHKKKGQEDICDFFFLSEWKSAICLVCKRKEKAQGNTSLSWEQLLYQNVSSHPQKSLSQAQVLAPLQGPLLSYQKQLRLDCRALH